MTRLLCGTLAVAAQLGATVFGQAPPQPIDAIFKDFTDHSPGCAVGATRGDAPLAAKGYGMADLEHGVPLTPQSVFYMPSRFSYKTCGSGSVIISSPSGAVPTKPRCVA